MKKINKIISAFCVVLLLLCFVGCDETIKDNNSEQQNSSVLQQLETPSNIENNVTNDNNDTQTNSSPDVLQQSKTPINGESEVINNNSDIQTNSPPDNNIQYLPDDYVNNADSDDEIDNDDLDGVIKDEESQSDDSSQENKPSENVEKIEYDDNFGWSSGWN